MEPDHNLNLSLPERFYNLEDLQSRGFKLQAPVLNGICFELKIISAPWRFRYRQVSPCTSL